MRRTYQVANGIFLLLTIGVSYLSNTGIFNGHTMAGVSARYQNLLTPAGYAFSIWGLIYLGLFGFVVYQGSPLFKKTGEDDGSILQIGPWFIVSCVANICWVLAWLYDYTGLSVVIMLALLFSLLKIVINTHMEMTDAPLKTIASVWWPFSLYSGWITVALIADIAAWLTKIKWGGFGTSAAVWAIIMICLAGAIYLFMTWTRNMREYAFVGVWGLVAVAVANRGVNPAVAHAALIVSAVLFVSSSWHGFKNREYNPWRKR
jgi:hypothetical protein